MALECWKNLLLQNLALRMTLTCFFCKKHKVELNYSVFQEKDY